MSSVRYNTTEFQWMNESEIRIDGNRIEITATPQSDFFCNSGEVSEEGITPESLSNAPYCFTEVEGDFVLHVKVSHDFKKNPRVGGIPETSRHHLVSTE